MIVSHFISDVVLTGCAIAAFLMGATKHQGNMRLLWGMFFLSVAATSGLGAIRYLGNPNLATSVRILSLFAATVGAAGIAFAAWTAMVGELRRRFIVAGLAKALAVFLLAALLKMYMLGLLVQGPVMLLLLVFGIIGTIKENKRDIGKWLLFAMLAIIAADGGRRVLTAQNITTPLHPLDWYHYFLALGMLLLGKGARRAAAAKAT